MELKPLDVRELNGFLVGTINWAGLTINMIKSKNAPLSAVFLPSAVFKDGVRLWGFKDSHPQGGKYKGLAKLEQYEDELVIVLCTKKELDRVVPVADLPNHIGQMPDGSYIGGRSIKKIITIKEALARKLGLMAIWTAAEADMRKYVAAQKAAERVRVQKEEENARKAKKEAHRQERADKRAAITARPRISVMTERGRRYGFPVVGNEWTFLTDSIYCIGVESYDAATKAAGKTLNAFVTTKKKGGQVQQAGLVAVAETQFVKKEQFSSLAKRIVTIHGEPEEVIVAGDMDEVRTLRDKGLNSGALVMAPNADDGDLFTVYRLREGAIESVTTLKRVHSASASA